MRMKDAPATIRLADASDGAPAGEFEALVSVFGNVDVVGDRVMPGAFAKSLERWAASDNAIPVIYSHAHSDPNALLGSVTDAKETADGLWVKGQLDLDSPAGASVYRAMRGRALTKFSFAYDVMAEAPAKDDPGVNELSELDLIEVGPTVIPANPETELLAVKHADAKAGRVLSAKNEERLRQARDLLGEVLSQLGNAEEATSGKAVTDKGPIGSHSTSTSGDSWDGAANVGRAEGQSALRAMHAWVDSEGDPEAKASYKFPHHEVSDSGSVGAANLAAASAGIAVLNGGRGGSSIPAADRQGVWNHLARHLRDGDKEPPALASKSSADHTRALAFAVGGETPGETA